MQLFTETELRYFALVLVLVDEKTEFAYRLDTIALKKTANRTVFEEISTELSCQEKISKKKIGANIVVEFCRQNEI
jgi:hypothetical protein